MSENNSVSYEYTLAGRLSKKVDGGIRTIRVS
jgi:hypothetical protein